MRNRMRATNLEWYIDCDHEHVIFTRIFNAKAWKCNDCGITVI